jgi:hypothetical protein
MDMSSMDVNAVLESPNFNADDTASMQKLFQRYKVQLNKTYPTPEADAQAFAEFQKSVRTVRQHNAEHKDGKHSYTLGINQFSDGTKPSCGLVAPTKTAAEPTGGDQPAHHPHHHHKHHAHHEQHQDPQ